jgi:hypothetical protein
MKSIKNSDVFKCPNGCEDFEHDFWSLVDAASSPELKEAALGGELNLIMCPCCGAYFHHNNSLIYFDSATKFLVFLFDEKDRGNEKELKEKMLHDYEIIKNSLAKEVNLSGAPVCVFGLEELKNLIEREEFFARESEVVAASSAEAGYKIAALNPSYARVHGYPFFVPVKAEKTASDLAGAAAAVLDKGLNSERLKKFATDARRPDFKPELL